MTPPPRRVYAGLFLLSVGGLLFQVTFVRIFSAAIWYHFAFLVISVALFGIGASGMTLALAGARLRTDRWRGIAPLGFAVSAVLGYLAVNAIPFSPFRILQEPSQIGWFLLDDLILAIPFFFFGLAVALALQHWPGQAGRLYAFDMLGAAAGSVLVFVALRPLGAPGTIALSAFLGAASAVLFAPPGRLRAGAAVAAVPCLLLVLQPSWLPDVRVDISKTAQQQVAMQGGRLVFTAWSPLARVDVVERPDLPPTIFLDAAAATPVAAPRTPATAAGEVNGLAGALRPNASCAVIGSGGGVDVQNALALGARQVTAIEINPVVLDLVRHRYRDLVGAVFEDPRIRVVNDEGRSYLARSRERHDIIQISLIDTWAASLSGAYSLSENYLYTVEAMRTYLDRLAPAGLVSIARWNYETPRLVSLARQALVETGVRNPSSHVAVVEERLQSLTLVRREPFPVEDVARLRAFVAAAPGRLLRHDPTAPDPTSTYGALLGAADPRALYAAAPSVLEPVRDESPFFFQMGRWRDVRPSVLRDFSGRGFLEPLALPVAQVTLLAALVLSVGLSLVLLGVPLAARAVPRESRWSVLAYFFGIGVAYIAVEVSLMQRLALLLGHPTYSVTLVLFTILTCSGLGAGWVDRHGAALAARPRWLLAGVVVALAFVAFGAPAIASHALGLELPVRVGVAVATVAPVAFLMGMPFPLAIRLLGERHAGYVAWAWAANGCGSVVGSVAAVLVAMLSSFGAVLVVSALIYAGVLSRIPALSRAASGDRAA